MSSFVLRPLRLGGLQFLSTPWPPSFPRPNLAPSKMPFIMDDNWRNWWTVRPHRHMCLILLPLWLLAMMDLASAGNKARGIDPKDLTYFQDDVIWCKDGSKSFPREHLNDNFCDCADGTDEPGTSACPRSKFYCKNTGSIPKLVFASQVNDGICDCCDGSDEYERQVMCANSCGNAASMEVDKNSVARIVDSNEHSSYNDSEMLMDEQEYPMGFWEAGSKDFISKLKDMRLLLGLQLLTLFCLLCWQCVMWLRVFRRRLKLRRSPFQLSTV